MTAEGARGCVWRAAGRRCRGCRHADVSRHRTQPYRTVPYHTVSYLTAGTYGKAYLTLSLSKKARGKESRCGKPAKMWKTLWKACGELVSRRSGRCGRARARRSMGACRQGGCAGAVLACGRAWSGGGAAVDRSCARGRGCGGADAGSGGGRVRRSMGACRQGGTCGCGRGFWSGTVWHALSAGAGVVDAFGWRVVAAVRCGTRVQRRARWLDFFQREKILDKLCKSILNWKQGITQAAPGDGLRHRPHRRSCSAHPTSTSSVAAWPPRHLPRIAKGDARSHPRRALPPRAPLRVRASHIHLIRRGDFGHVLRVRRAPFRRCPPQNGDEKLRPASNRCWAEFCDSSRAGAAAFSLAFRLPFRWLSCAAAFSLAFLCACGHRAAFLTRPSRSCPRATPRTGCAYGRSGGRTPSSPATTAGQTR